MWLVYTILHMFCMSLVNYLDEYLTHSSSTKQSLSLHERIGGVLIMSTLLCVIGSLVLYVLSPSLNISQAGLAFAVFSAVPMVAVWAGYFYLFQVYSAHQVVPLFGLTSIWLLAFELAAGAAISLVALGGIALLIMGAYLLDNGSLKWKIPSKLLVLMLPISFAWALSVFMVRLATETDDAFPIYFWQLIGVILIGLMLFSLVPPYRTGFLTRVKTERRKFIVPSLMNESCAQVSFMFGTLAVAVAPLAVYVTAANGIQSVCLLLLLRLFPLDGRNIVTSAQWVGVFCIAAGIALLEAWK